MEHTVSVTPSLPLFIRLLLGLAAAAITVFTLAGMKVPLLANERANLIALLVLGMALCTNGIGRFAAANAWAHPLAILGYLLGAGALIIAGMVLAGKPLPVIDSPRAAIFAITAIMVLKILIEMGYSLTQRGKL